METLSSDTHLAERLLAHLRQQAPAQPFRAHPSKLFTSDAAAGSPSLPAGIHEHAAKQTQTRRPDEQDPAGRVRAGKTETKAEWRP